MGSHAHMMNMFANTRMIYFVTFILFFKTYILASLKIATNFSHRIDDFSFGDNSHLVHNALNFDLKIANTGLTKNFVRHFSLKTCFLTFKYRKRQL